MPAILVVQATGVVLRNLDVISTNRKQEISLRQKNEAISRIMPL